MAFGLQYLDGIGDAYDASIRNEQENSRIDEFESDVTKTDNGYEEVLIVDERGKVCKCESRKCNRLNKLLIFCAGIIAGQALKKLFKD